MREERGENRRSYRTSGQVNPTAPIRPNQTPTRGKPWKPHITMRKQKDTLNENDAETCARQLHRGSEILLETLFRYLSKLPEEDDDSLVRQGGMTLPVAAVGWLSGQLYPIDCEDEDTSTIAADPLWMGVALRDRLSLLRFLLPRVTHLRLVRDVWPPTFSQKELGNSNSYLEHENNPRPPEELNCSTISVSSALTTDTLHVPPTRKAFLKYFRNLQNQPRVDMRVFPKLQALVLEGIPPAWITNLFTLKSSLQLFRSNKACLYDLPSLFFPSTESQITHGAFSPIRISGDASDPGDLLATNTETICQSVIYVNLTHCNLDFCGIGELSGLPQTIRKLENLQSLSLAHNDICTEKTALKGLRHLSSLSKLDLSFNSLKSLRNVHGNLGQIRILRLSHNLITTGQGLDRLYSLEELFLDHNKIKDVQDISRLAELPLLKKLNLSGNPFKSKYRVPFLVKFQQHRQCSCPEEVLVLDNSRVSDKEWGVLQRKSFRPLEFIRILDTENIATAIPIGYNSSMPPVRNRRVRRRGRRKEAVIKSLGHYRALNEKKSTPLGISSLFSQKSQNQREIHVGFTIKDVLFSLKDGKCDSFQEERVESSSTVVRVTENLVPEPSSPVTDSVLNEGFKELEKRNVPQTIISERTSAKVTIPGGEIFRSQSRKEVLGTKQLKAKKSKGFDASQPDDVVEIEKSFNPTPALDNETKSFTACNQGEASNLKEDLGTPNLMLKLDPEVSPSIDSRLSLGCDQRNVSSHVDLSRRNTESKERSSIIPASNTSSLNLHAGSVKKFDVFEVDWDELVQHAAEGTIPNGKVRTPFSIDTDQRNGKLCGIFSEDILSPPQGMDTSRDSFGVKQEATRYDDIETESECQSRKSIVTPQASSLVLRDDFSISSSLGTNREDFPISRKFQLAEERTRYDGPEACKDMNVLKNLELFFDTFVFSASPQLSIFDAENEEEEDRDEEDWQYIALRHPRIKLCPDDQRLLDNAPEAFNSDSWESNRERFVRIWEEDLVPCGKPALRRLGPNRRTRLGFHGDQLYENGTHDVCVGCRKVFLCLSSSAFYVIPREDDVTSGQPLKFNNKTFPAPLSDRTLFNDAVWPHAVARHTFHDLQAITIGFEFQRLTLRFSNPAFRKTDPYVYILLTSNKAETVELLQEIQRLAKETNEYVTDLVSDATAVAIENDSQIVFDALALTVAPDLVGTIIHYQIVQQRWKHGERGTVRRACIITDSKLFLLDEDYAADGHQELSQCKQAERFADVTYKIIDEASLNQIEEVQAASSDPKAITIVIQPLSRLSRTHRWRLVCRQSNGAERLVSDVRKAMALANDGIANA